MNSKVELYLLYVDANLVAHTTVVSQYIAQNLGNTHHEGGIAGKV